MEGAKSRPQVVLEGAKSRGQVAVEEDYTAALHPHHVHVKML